MNPTSPSSGLRVNERYDSTTTKCPLKHWFDLTLKIVSIEIFESWWHVEWVLENYPYEDIRIDLLGEPVFQKLNGAGNINIQTTQTGSAVIVFHKFYEEIEKELKRGTEYAPSDPSPLSFPI